MSAFVPYTQAQLKALRVEEGAFYYIEYLNKDYYNAEESIEKSRAQAVLQEGNIYFNVLDPYGIEKLVMQVRILGR